MSCILAIQCAAHFIRNKEEQGRNPSFEPFLPTIACSIYTGVVHGINHFENEDQKVSAVAKSLISYAISLSVSAAVIHGMGYRSFNWVADLTCLSVIFFASQVAHENKSKRGCSLVLLIAHFARSCIEKMRNDQADLVSLTIPGVIEVGCRYALAARVAKWTKLDFYTVHVIISSFFAWALTAPVCSLLGRQVVIYSRSNLALALVMAPLVELGARASKNKKAKGASQ